jgi:hypothetical protein
VGKIVSITSKVGGYTATTISGYSLPTKDTSSIAGHIVCQGGGTSSGLGITNATLNAAIDAATGFTWLCYGKLVSAGATLVILDQGPKPRNGSAQFMAPKWTSNTFPVHQLILEDGAVNGAYGADPGGADSTWHTWTVTWDKTLSVLWNKDGTTSYSAVRAPGAFTTADVILRNYTNSFQGVSALWGRVLTASELTAARAAMTAKYT